jgi:hypothetical protein|tara:strand:- start:581 stop:772 length:192 start_codon:yes stop_codon:yes gene_type:complete
MLSQRLQQLVKGIRKMPKGLYANMNARKKKGTSRSKSKSTISDKAYKNMQAGFPKKKSLLKKG